MNTPNTITITPVANDTNYPFVFGRWFKKGEIVNYPQAIIDGTPVPTGAYVDTTWADGSVQYARLSCTIPSMTSGVDITITFQDQTTPDTATFNPSDILNDASYDFESTFEIEGYPLTEGTHILSARAMLAAGVYEIRRADSTVFEVMVGDRSANRIHDFGFEGYNNLHPVYHLQMYPQKKIARIAWRVECSNMHEIIPARYVNMYIRYGNSSPSLKYDHVAKLQEQNQECIDLDHYTWRFGTWWGWIDYTGGTIEKHHLNHNASYLIEAGGCVDIFPRDGQLSGESTKLAAIKNYMDNILESPFAPLIAGGEDSDYRTGSGKYFNSTYLAQSGMGAPGYWSSIGYVEFLEGFWIQTSFNPDLTDYIYNSILCSGIHPWALRFRDGTYNAPHTNDAFSRNAPSGSIEGRFVNAYSTERMGSNLNIFSPADFYPANYIPNESWNYMVNIPDFWAATTTKNCQPDEGNYWYRHRLTVGGLGQQQRKNSRIKFTHYNVFGVQTMYLVTGDSWVYEEIELQTCINTVGARGYSRYSDLASKRGTGSAMIGASETRYYGWVMMRRVEMGKFIKESDTIFKDWWYDTIKDALYGFCWEADQAIYLPTWVQNETRPERVDWSIKCNGSTNSFSSNNNGGVADYYKQVGGEPHFFTGGTRWGFGHTGVVNPVYYSGTINRPPNALDYRWWSGSDSEAATHTNPSGILAWAIYENFLPYAIWRCWFILHDRFDWVHEAAKALLTANLANYAIYRMHPDAINGYQGVEGMFYQCSARLPAVKAPPIVNGQPTFTDVTMTTIMEILWENSELYGGGKFALGRFTNAVYTCITPLGPLTAAQYAVDFGLVDMSYLKPSVIASEIPNFDITNYNIWPDYIQAYRDKSTLSWSDTDPHFVGGINNTRPVSGPNMTVMPATYRTDSLTQRVDPAAMYPSSVSVQPGNGWNLNYINYSNQSNCVIRLQWPSGSGTDQVARITIDDGSNSVVHPNDLNSVDGGAVDYPPIDLSGLNEGLLTVTVEIISTPSGSNTYSNIRKDLSTPIVPTATTIDAVPGSNRADNISTQNETSVPIKLTWPLSANALHTFTFTLTSASGGGTVTGTGNCNPGGDTTTTVNCSSLFSGLCTLQVRVESLSGSQALITFSGVFVLDTNSPVTPNFIAGSNINNANESDYSVDVDWPGSQNWPQSSSYIDNFSGVITDAGGTSITGQGTGVVQNSTQVYNFGDVSSLADGFIDIYMIRQDESYNTSVSDTFTVSKSTASFSGPTLLTPSGNHRFNEDGNIYISSSPLYNPEISVPIVHSWDAPPEEVNIAIYLEDEAGNFAFVNEPIVTSDAVSNRVDYVNASNLGTGLIHTKYAVAATAGGSLYTGTGTPLYKIYETPAAAESVVIPGSGTAWSMNIINTSNAANLPIEIDFGTGADVDTNNTYVYAIHDAYLTEVNFFEDNETNFIPSTGIHTDYLDVSSLIDRSAADPWYVTATTIDIHGNINIVTAGPIVKDTVGPSELTVSVPASDAGWGLNEVNLLNESQVAVKITNSTNEIYVGTISIDDGVSSPVERDIGVSKGSVTFEMNCSSLNDGSLTLTVEYADANLNKNSISINLTKDTEVVIPDLEFSYNIDIINGWYTAGYTIEHVLLNDANGPGIFIRVTDGINTATGTIRSSNVTEVNNPIALINNEVSLW
jgi:hypothetical protein